MITIIHYKQKDDTWFTKPLLGHHSLYVVNIVKKKEKFIVLLIDTNDTSVVECKVCGTYNSARTKAKQLLKDYGVKFQDSIRRTL